MPLFFGYSEHIFTFCYFSSLTVCVCIYFLKTYKILKALSAEAYDFLDTLGEVAKNGFKTLGYLLTGQISRKELIEQCSRFGVSSLPITLSIVGMTSIIVASQVASEMVKQGGGHFVGMMMTVLIVREVGAIMSGFAIISMIGSLRNLQQ